MKVGFATYRNFPQQYGASEYGGTFSPYLTVSDEKVSNYLDKMGVSCIPLIWDRKDELVSCFDIIIIRSTYNYYHSYENIKKFLIFIDNIKDKVHNSKSAIEWNYKKTYLEALYHAGIPIVPTTFIETKNGLSLSSIPLHVNPELDIVIKPAVSGAGRNTFRISYKNQKNDISMIDDIYRCNKIDLALIQQFNPSFVQAGEISLIFFRDEFSHAVRRQSSFEDFANPNEVSALNPVPDAAIKFAQKVLSETYKILMSPPGSLLYARVDLLPQENDNYLLSELELIEPELFLQHTEGGEERFGDAILSVIEKELRFAG